MERMDIVISSSKRGVCNRPRTISEGAADERAATLPARGAAMNRRAARRSGVPAAARPAAAMRGPADHRRDDGVALAQRPLAVPLAGQVHPEHEAAMLGELRISARDGAVGR